MSTVVMTDYITKLAISTVPDDYFECLNHVTTDMYNYCFGITGSNADLSESEL